MGVVCGVRSVLVEVARSSQLDADGECCLWCFRCSGWRTTWSWTCRRTSISSYPARAVSSSTRLAWRTRATTRVGPSTRPPAASPTPPVSWSTVSLLASPPLSLSLLGRKGESVDVNLCYLAPVHNILTARCLSSKSGRWQKCLKVKKKNSCCAVFIHQLGLPILIFFFKTAEFFCFFFKKEE